MTRHRLLTAALGAAVVLLSLSSCVSQREQRLSEFRSAPLFGMVYDHDQKPVAGAEILVDGGAEARSDINGRFVLRSLPPGKYTVVVRKEDYEELTVEVEFLNRTQALYLKAMSLSQLLREVESALQARQPGRAAVLLERAAAVRADDPVHLYLRGVYLLQTGDPRGAAEVLVRILDLGYEEPSVCLSLSDIYQYQLNDRATAAEYLQRYLRVQRDPQAERRLQALREL